MRPPLDVDDTQEHPDEVQYVKVWTRLSSGRGLTALELAGVVYVWHWLAWEMSEI